MAVCDCSTMTSDYDRIRTGIEFMTAYVSGNELLTAYVGNATPDLAQRFSKVAPHIGLAACGNTMKAQGVKLDDLLPGFVRVDEGGVVQALVDVELLDQEFQQAR